jgi:hypothetical protein
VDFRAELTDLTGKIRYLAVSQQIDVRMSTDIQKLRREDSYSAVIGGKGLV